MVGIPTQEVLRLPFQATSTNEQLGEFSGIAANWNIDLQQSRFQRGAFIATIAEAQKKAKSRNGEVLFVLLWQHNKTDAGPIGGITSAVETDRGLEVTGFIDLTGKSGQRAYSGLKKGYLSDLSVAFIPRQSHYEGTVRVISKVELIEISIVTFGAQPGARVTNVKTLDIKDVELKMERILAQLRFREERSEKMKDDYDMDDDADERFAPRRERPQYFGGSTIKLNDYPNGVVLYQEGEPGETMQDVVKEMEADLRRDDDLYQLHGRAYERELQARKKAREERQRLQREALAAEKAEQEKKRAMMSRDTLTPRQFAEETGLDEPFVRNRFNAWIQAGLVTPLDEATLTLSREDAYRMAKVEWQRFTSRLDELAFQRARESR